MPRQKEIPFLLCQLVSEDKPDYPLDNGVFTRQNIRRRVFVSAVLYNLKIFREIDVLVKA